MGARRVHSEAGQGPDRSTLPTSPNSFPVDMSGTLKVALTELSSSSSRIVTVFGCHRENVASLPSHFSLAALAHDFAKAPDKGRHGAGIAGGCTLD